MKTNHLDTNVELLLAFSWNCPNCGREKFEKPIAVALSRAEMQELSDEYGVDPEHDGGSYYRSPTKVGCPFCQMTFDAVQFDDLL